VHRGKETLTVMYLRRGEGNGCSFGRTYVIVVPRPVPKPLPATPRPALLSQHEKNSRLNTCLFGCTFSSTVARDRLLSRVNICQKLQGYKTTPCLKNPRASWLIEILTTGVIGIWCCIRLQVDRNLMLYLPRLAVLVRIEAD
jgi:hypothetical protein